FQVRPISANRVKRRSRRQTANRRTPNSAGLTHVLQTYKSPSMPVDEGGSTHDIPYPVQPSLTDLYATVIGFVRRQFAVVLWAVLLIIGLAAVYLFATPPLYSAGAKLMIDTGKVQVL